MKKILIFTARWCSPCRQLHIDLDNIQYDYTNFSGIEYVDVDKQENIAIKNRVKNVPTILLMEDGETILRLTGYNKDILESIKAFLVEPTVEQKEFTSKLFAKANAIAKEVKEEKETEQTEEENKKKDLKN